MSRTPHAGGKRQREAAKAQKKREKAARKQARKEQGGESFEIASVEEVVGPLPSIEEAMRNIEERTENPGGAAPIPTKLFVGSLSYDTTERSLAEAFGAFGALDEVSVVIDRDTGRSRGFGFVVMSDRKDAQRAIKALDGSELDGRTIAVDVATER